MCKARLHELIQKKHWDPPIYITNKNGPCHMPRFTATVIVMGQAFKTPQEFTLIKDAHNCAAGIAFRHFNYFVPVAAVSEPPPAVNSRIPPIPVVVPAAPPAEMQPIVGVLQPFAQPSGLPDCLFKARLHDLVQKKRWDPPIYETSINGPCHLPWFTATVTVMGQVFKTPQGCKSIKEAHNFAARIAFQHFNSFAPVAADSSEPVVPAAPQAEMQPIVGVLLPSPQPSVPPRGYAVASSSGVSTATVRKHQDTTNEEPERDAKRGKASLEG